jgi:hypothetical protein
VEAQRGTNPQSKKSHEVKSGDKCDHHINASFFFFFLCVLSTFVASFDGDTLARLYGSEPESRLVEDVIITVFIQL